MAATLRQEFIESAAKRQFRPDYPGREWDCIEAASAEMDRRALYLFQAEEYLITHGVIAPLANAS